MRRRAPAAFFALPAIALGVWGVHELLQGPVNLALSMLAPGYAMTVFVALLLFAAWRAWSVIHAYALTMPRTASRRRGWLARPSGGAASVLAILLVAILATHVVPAYYAWSAYAADTKLGGGLSFGPSGTPDPSQLPVMTTPKPGESVGPLPSANWGSGHRQTILIVGVDAGPGRSQALTDTMMVVSVNMDDRKVAMISVPRDTTMFELYWNGATLGTTFKLNALASGVARQWFPAPSSDPMTILKNEIAYLVGIPVDYYAAMDLYGFGGMIDMAGGVDIYNAKAFYDPLQRRQWNQGMLHLGGADALLYVRSRYGDNDYMRASRQQDLLVALEKKLATPQMLVRLPDFLGLVGSSVRTDYPLDRVKDTASFAETLPSDAISKCVLGPPFSYHPDSATTNGVWTSRLDMDRVGALSASVFGKDSAYYGKVDPHGCKD